MLCGRPQSRMRMQRAGFSHSHWVLNCAELYGRWQYLKHAQGRGKAGTGDSSVRTGRPCGAHPARCGGTGGFGAPRRPPSQRCWTGWSSCRRTPACLAPGRGGSAACRGALGGCTSAAPRRTGARALYTQTVRSASLSHDMEEHSTCAAHTGCQGLLRACDKRRWLGTHLWVLAKLLR